jgi:uncharacterized iron-regulated protein
MLPLRALGLLVLLLAPGCAPKWISPLGREHPLAGKIWDVGADRLISERDLVARLAAARFVLLGERHDNPDHHRLQARAIEGIAGAGRRPAVAFEMIGSDAAGALAEATASAEATAEQVRAAVRWDQSGWPAFEIYAPVFQAALGARLRLVAANLPREQAKAIGREGLAALDRDTTARLALDTPLPEAERADLLDELRRGHCGHGDERMLARMSSVQNARDAAMADALLGAGEAGAVLIAGGEHVRRDRGVPVWLARRAPDAVVASVGFVEVHGADPDPRGPLDLRAGEAVPFDFVWFTARVDDLDPCDRYRRELERLRAPRVE